MLKLNTKNQGTNIYNAKAEDDKREPEQCEQTRINIGENTLHCETESETVHLKQQNERQDAKFDPPVYCKKALENIFRVIPGKRIKFSNSFLISTDLYTSYVHMYIYRYLFS